MYSTQSYNHCKDYIVNDLTELKLLLAEVDRLTAENEELNGLVGVNPRTLEHEINRLTAENDRKAGEIERLKTVAELASDLLTSLESDAGPTFEFPRLRYALAALNPEEKP